MISRDEVYSAYRLILGRDPESEASVAAHQSESSLDELGRRLLSSEEFRRRMALKGAAASKWVCTEIHGGLRLWIDLADFGVSSGGLHDNWEPAETDFILSALAPGDTFIDVGANIGWFTILAANRVGPEGRVYAFEPRADSYHRLTQSIADNGFGERCRAESFALGAKEGEIELAWVPGEQNPGHSFIVSGELPGGAERLGKVQIKTLDSFNIETPVRLMKIDVEGAEFQVLSGARALIARDHPMLLLEVFPKWLETVSNTTADALFSWLREMDYRIFNLADTGIGHELHPGGNVFGPGGPDYTNVIALSEADCARLLSLRLDHRVADLEELLKAERGAREAVEARMSEANARMEAETASLQAHMASEYERFAAEHSTLKSSLAAEASEALASAANTAVAAAEEQTRQLEEHLARVMAEAETQKAMQRAVEMARVAAEREVFDLRTRLHHTGERLHSVEMSTIWRASSPLRSVAQTMPGGIRRNFRRAARVGWWTVTLQLPRRLRERAAAGRTPPSSAPAKDVEPSLPVAGTPVSAPYLPAPTRPRVLMVDSRWPRPDRDSGSMDAWLQAKALKNFGYEVIFVGDAEFGEDSHYRERLEAEGIICLSPAICPSVQAFIERDGNSLDFCLLSRFNWGGGYLELIRYNAPRTKIVFNTVDLHYLRETREAELLSSKEALQVAEATRARELEIVRQSDATIVVSAAEYQELLREVPGANVFEVPLARPVSAVGGIPAFTSRSGVGFVGGFEHAPNIDAIRYLFAEIWPLVLQQKPELTLTIVGSGLPDDILAEAPANTQYLGPLPSLDPWLDGLRLTVAPLRYGAGAKGKVASSLAAGVPCVGTPVAAEGMRLRDGMEIAICRTAEDFAARICEVHDDADLWSRLSTGGHEKASQEFSLHAGDERLATVLRALGLPAPGMSDARTVTG